MLIHEFFAAQDDDANKADQEVIADDQDNADQGSSSRQGHRQFVGFCNPQDHVEMDMPSSTIHNNCNNSRKHKKFLPQVLKNDPEDHDSVSFIFTNSVLLRICFLISCLFTFLLQEHLRHHGTAQSSSSNLINSDSATFAYPEINEPIRSSSPSYGALE